MSGEIGNPRAFGGTIRVWGGNTSFFFFRMEFYQCQASPDHRKFTNAFVTAGRLGESQSGGPHLSSRTLTEVSQFLRLPDLTGKES